MSERTVTIGEATVVMAGPRTETHFSDGTVCAAVPEPTESYRRTAADLGYGEDVGRLSRCHELSHSLLAASRGLPVSPVLWAVAHGLPATDEHYAEEDEAMALQLFCNRGIRPKGDLPWDEMKRRLLAIVGDLEITGPRRDDPQG